MKIKPIDVLFPVEIDGKEQTVTKQELVSLFEKGKLSNLVFIGHGHGIGESIVILKPALTSNSEKLFYEIINILGTKKFRDPESTEKLTAIFKMDKGLSTRIIDMCMPIQLPDSLSAYIYNMVMREWPENDIKDLITTLIECGADYENLLVDPRYRPEHLSQFFKYMDLSCFNRTFQKTPLLAIFVMGKCDGDIGLQKIETALNCGVSPNIVHPEFGSFLHIVIANEYQDSVSACINLLLEKAKAPGMEAFDFKAVDGEGKTCLLLAVKTNQTGIAQLLIACHKKGKDIGVNTPDKTGATPLLYAAALGNEQLVESLLAIGADPAQKDNNNRDLKWYASAPSHEVANILKSIFIHPDRDAEAEHSWLYFNDPYVPPITVEASTETHHRVLISKLDEHWKLLQQVLKEAIDNSNDYPAGLADFIKSQIKPLEKSNGKTILQKCMEGRPLVQKTIATFIASQKEEQLREGCALGDIELVQKLISEHVNINAAKQTGMTPAHYTVLSAPLTEIMIKQRKCTRTFEECVTNRAIILIYLSEHGADLTIKNRSKLTVVEILRNTLNDAKSSESEKNMANKVLLSLQGIDNNTSAAIPGSSLKM